VLPSQPDSTQGRRLGSPQGRTRNGAQQLDCALPTDSWSIAIWGTKCGAEKPTVRLAAPVEELDLPLIEEVDAWDALERLDAEAAARGGAAPWTEVRQTRSDQAGASRPVTVTAVAALMLVLAMIHSLGALGTVSLGAAREGLGRAVLVGVLALLVGVAETVCAVLVVRGKGCARIVAVSLGLLVLVWLTMVPWSPGVLTVMVFAAWLAVGVLLAHPMSSRFFAAAATEPGPITWLDAAKA
jgi:hypothetical protein